MKSYLSELSGPHPSTLRHNDRYNVVDARWPTEEEEDCGELGVSISKTASKDAMMAYGRDRRRDCTSRRDFEMSVSAYVQINVLQK